MRFFLKNPVIKTVTVYILYGINIKMVIDTRGIYETASVYNHTAVPDISAELFDVPAKTGRHPDR